MQSGTVTALEIQKRNKERVNLYLDGEFVFGIPLIEAAKLHKGQHLDEQQLTELRHADAVQRAVDRGARFLSYRPRSIDEIRRNLLKHETPESVVEIAIERLSNLGYLDDMAFAKFWLENRDTFKPRGPMALRHELRSKGISNEIIEIVLESLDAPDAAYRAAQSKVRAMRGKTLAEFRKKVGSFLQRRGFNYQTSRDVLEQLIQELTDETPDYFAPNDTDRGYF